MSSTKLALSTLGLAAAFCCAPAGAVTYTLNLTQDGPILPYFNNGVAVGSTTQFTSLGSGAIPAFNLVAGDVLNVFVQLSTAIVLPAGNLGYIELVISPATGNSTASPGQARYNQAVSYFSNNMALPAPPSFNYYSGSGGALVLGGGSFGSFVPQYTFDSATYVMTMESSAGNVMAVGNGGNAFARLNVYNLSPVPEPASAALVLAGLLGLVGLSAHRARRRGVSAPG